MAEYLPTHIFSGRLTLINAAQYIERVSSGSNYRLYITELNDETPFLDSLCQVIENTSTVSALGIDTSTVSSKHLIQIFQTLRKNDSIASVILYPYDAYYRVSFYPMSFFPITHQMTLLSVLRLNPRISDINWFGFLDEMRTTFRLAAPPSMLEFLLATEHSEIASKKKLKNVA